VRIALAQIDTTLGDVEENVRRARAVVADAREQGAELVVFPELSLTGYAIGAIEADIATRADDARIAAAGLEDVGVVVGFPERRGARVFNTAAYLEGGELLHVQRKLHLPTYDRFEEHKHFSAGDGLRAFDTALGRFALLICFDAWQPPLPFLAVHDGAEVLIVPSCSAQGAAPDAELGEIERDWRLLLEYHARVLQAYVVFVNRVGSEPETTFWGGSTVLDPWGRVIAQGPALEPALVLADLDLDAVRRRRREMPLLKEPRLELVRRELGRLLEEHR
jgi:predicted amidohydrolase